MRFRSVRPAATISRPEALGVLFENSKSSTPSLEEKKEEGRLVQKASCGRGSLRVRPLATSRRPARGRDA